MSDAADDEVAGLREWLNGAREFCKGDDEEGEKQYIRWIAAIDALTATLAALRAKDEIAPLPPTIIP